MEVHKTYFRAVKGCRIIQEVINDKILVVALGIFALISACFLVAKNLKFRDRSTINIDPQLFQEMVIELALHIILDEELNQTPKSDKQASRGGRA